MAASIKHKLVSAIADDAAAKAAGQVCPSDWNAEHDVTITPADIGAAPDIHEHLIAGTDAFGQAKQFRVVVTNGVIGVEEI